MSAPLLSMAASDAAARAQVLRRLELAIAHRLDGRDSGDHASYTYGPGKRAGRAPDRTHPATTRGSWTGT